MKTYINWTDMGCYHKKFGFMISIKEFKGFNSILARKVNEDKEYILNKNDVEILYCANIN